MRQAEVRIEEDRAEVIAAGDAVDEVLENDYYLQRLDAGLATLQNIDRVAGEICLHCGAAARDRFLQLLKLQGGRVETLVAVVTELAENSGEPEPGETAPETAARVARLQNKSVAGCSR